MIRVIVFAFAVFALLGAAPGQAYPDKPVRIIVAYPAGGGPDMVARVIAQKLNEKSVGTFVVENRPGANGNIATNVVSKAEPDGYTVLMASDGPITINPNLFEKLPFDPIKDLAPITLVASAPLILMTTSSLKVSSVQDLLALARANRGKLSFASSGPGSQHHLAGELLKLRGGVDLIHVPYKGFGAAVGDAIGGNVDVIFGTIPAALPHVKSGKLKALAIASAERFPAVPNLPTMKEAGLPDFEVAAWFGLLAPAKTPPAAIQWLHREISKVVNMDDVRQRFQQQGMIVSDTTPEEFARYIVADTRRWGELIRAAGIKLQ